MNFSAYEMLRPRSDGTTPGRRNTAGDALAIRAELRDLVGRARNVAVKRIAAERRLSEACVRRIASGAGW